MALSAFSRGGKEFVLDNRTSLNEGIIVYLNTTFSVERKSGKEDSRHGKGACQLDRNVAFFLPGETIRIRAKDHKFALSEFRLSLMKAQ